MGLSVFIPTGDNHGDPLISPVVVISRANFAGLLGIAHTQEILVGLAYFGTFLEVAESLKRGSVSCVAILARTIGKPT